MGTIIRNNADRKAEKYLYTAKIEDPARTGLALGTALGSCKKQ